MNRIERAIRRAVNPLSTRATMLLQGGWRRRRIMARVRRGRRPPGVEAIGLSRPVAGKRAGPIGVRTAPIPADAVSVPNLLGLTCAEAVSVLREVGLSATSPHGDQPLRELTEGIVVDQHPASGFHVRRGSSVTLWVRGGPGSAGMREPRRPRPRPRAASGAWDEQRGGRLTEHAAHGAFRRRAGRGPGQGAPIVLGRSRLVSGSCREASLRSSGSASTDLSHTESRRPSCTVALRLKERLTGLRLSAKRQGGWSKTGY